MDPNLSLGTHIFTKPKQQQQQSLGTRIFIKPKQQQQQGVSRKLSLFQIFQKSQFFARDPYIHIVPNDHMTPTFL